MVLRLFCFIVVPMLFCCFIEDWLAFYSLEVCFVCYFLVDILDLNASAMVLLLL